MMGAEEVTVGDDELQNAYTAWRDELARDEHVAESVRRIAARIVAGNGPAPSGTRWTGRSRRTTCCWAPPRCC